MPEWALPILLQIPLVAAVAYGFISGQVRRGGEVTEWKQLYDQERKDRLEADRRLTIATTEMREVVDKIEGLTKEVIRNGIR